MLAHKPYVSVGVVLTRRRPSCYDGSNGLNGRPLSEIGFENLERGPKAHLQGNELTKSWVGLGRLQSLPRLALFNVQRVVVSDPSRHHKS